MLDPTARQFQDEEDPDARRWAQEHRRFLAENRPDVLRALQGPAAWTAISLRWGRWRASAWTTR